MIFSSLKLYECVLLGSSGILPLMIFSGIVDIEQKILNSAVLLERLLWAYSGNFFVKRIAQDMTGSQYKGKFNRAESDALQDKKICFL